jgi:uncharacterized protein YegP (UPF0339 family)
MAGKFVVKSASNGKFMFNLKAGNGEIILTSQMYADKSSALSGVESVRKNAADDSRFDRRKSKNDAPYFALVATNGQDIGRSETYSSASAMENGIASVKSNALAAKVVEE